VIRRPVPSLAHDNRSDEPRVIGRNGPPLFAGPCRAVVGSRLLRGTGFRAAGTHSSTTLTTFTTSSRRIQLRGERNIRFSSRSIRLSTITIDGGNRNGCIEASRAGGESSHFAD
jgi:hypothetical protein